MAPETTAGDGGALTDGTCDECGLSLDEAQEQPAGYTALTTDGRHLCGACDTIRRGHQRRDRKTADELAESDVDQESEGEDRGRSPVNEAAL